MKKTKWSFGLVQRTFFLMLFVFIIILGLMSLQGITEYKERLISSTYDASLTSGLQSIYQTEYSLDNKNMTKYLKNYYLTNEGMSAIVDSDNNIKSFVSSASLHVSQLGILDENKSQEIMVDISENNLVKKINEYMIAHPDENYEVVIGGAQSKKKQYYINDGEQEVEYYTSMDTTGIHPAYLAINGKVLLNNSHKSLKKYKVSWYMSERCFYERNGSSGGREFTDYKKLKKALEKQIKKIDSIEYAKGSDYVHSKSINVGDGTMTMVLSELNQEISSVSNTSGVKGYFVSASFIPKLTKRAAVNYFEHSWYIYIIVLWLNVVISIVISHMITKPLRHVSEVTSEIAKMISVRSS